MRNVLCLICLLCVLWGWLGGAELTNAGQFTALAPGRCGEPYLTRPTHSIIMCAAMCSSNGDSCDAFSVGHEATGDGGKGRACELVTLGSLQASPTTAAIAEDVYYKCYVTKAVSDLFTTPPPTSTTTPTPTSAALSTITTDVQEGYKEFLDSELLEDSMTCIPFTYCRLSSLFLSGSRVGMTKTLQQFTPLTANTTSTSFFSSSLQVEACPNGSVVVGLEYMKAEDADTPAWHKLVCSPVLPELNFTNQYCHYSSEFITGMLNCTKEEYLVGVRWNSSSIKTGSVRINAKCCSKTQQFMTPTYFMGY